MADLYEKHHKIVATWVSVKDYEGLKILADANKVNLSVYIRAIITDALQEELYLSTCNTIQNTNTKVV